MSETAPYLVLGTAGHIDHGKTALIKAMTGIDCDTMQEEKDRGITINLGFAHYSLPSGIRLGIIDVPGHRRFIRNMVAGAQGIDLVMLVTAADDGVMPQTSEHLHIVRLLGVRAGLVALNKIDLVDEELRELAIADVEELLFGTFLEDCRIIPVSAHTGEGVEELVKALDELAQSVPPRSLGDRFRMPIDRVFTIKGAGTVVTGTTLAGEVKEGNEVAILPGGKHARVRTIQIHGEPAKSAGPGKRVAINLAGIEKEDLTRGHVIAEPDSLETTYMFDARLELLPGDYRPLTSGSAVHLHIGTAEVTARMYPLDKPLIEPGRPSLTQLRLNTQVAISAGDRFILRNATQEDTIGGGEVLDAHPLKHQKKREEVAEKISELAGTGLDAAIRHEVSKTPYGTNYTALLKLLNVGSKALDDELTKLASADGRIIVYGEGNKRYFTLPENRERIAVAVEKALGAHHKAHPLLAKGLTLKGIMKGVESIAGAEIPLAVLQESVNEAVKKGTIAEAESTYVLPGLQSEFSKDDELTMDIILEYIGNSASPKQLSEHKRGWPVDKKRLRNIVEHLLESGRIVTAPGGIMFSGKAIEWIRKKGVDCLAKKSEATVSEMREHLGTSRKFAIPLLQYFEDEGTIVRDGDVRRLKK